VQVKSKSYTCIQLVQEVKRIQTQLLQRISAEQIPAAPEAYDCLRNVTSYVANL